METIKKIDRRINYKLVLDVESCPIDEALTKANASNMFCYDIGFVVTDKKGRIYESESLTIRDIFIDEKNLMESAYYAEKIPSYWEDIKNRKRKIVSFYLARTIIKTYIDLYQIKEFWAYNCYFDYTCLNQTQRWLTKSKYRYFLPYGVEPYDILKLTRQLVATMPTYKRFCEKNGFMTKNNRPQLKAETVYRYISGNYEFEEVHQGLADCEIEAQILAYCYRKHKKMDGHLFKKRVDK